MGDTRLVLIRHGEAECGVARVVGGAKGCTGLSELGRRQATLLHDRLVATGELAGASALYASVLPRAIETAEIIAPALGGLEVRQDCDLCEVHPGEADALDWDEVVERWAPSPSTYREWAPGAETWAQFVARVGARLVGLVEEHQGETVVVAGHGGIVDSSFAILGHVPLFRPFDLFTENTSLTEWTTPDDPAGWPPARWRLVRYNDAAHLQSLVD